LAKSYNNNRNRDDGRHKSGYNEETILHKLSEILDEERLTHSLGVREACAVLAVRYGADVAKARIAGLVHDCARGLDDSQLLRLGERYGINIDEWKCSGLTLLHGPVGAGLARELFGISDEEILHAITVHTTGSEDMGLLDLILFVADYIEPNRTFNGVEEIRSAAEESLELAALKGYASTIKYLLDRDRLIHPRTIYSRNSLLAKVLKSKALASKE